MIHEPLLAHNPELGTVTLTLLIGIANAIEREAVRRYASLAEVMERRGEAATAMAFRVMLEEERKHVGAVERWAASLGEPLQDDAEFTWRLPTELSKSWDEVAGSALLTPYRAFAIAVDNERRAFALYSYLAANADDPGTAAHAERLALEELRHAALMRHWRRQAWHRERRAERGERPIVVATRESLRALLSRREAAIVARHRVIVARLRTIGDDESAQLLEQLAATPSYPPDDAPAQEDDMNSVADDPVHLLTAAQEPLEALAETLEAIMPTTEGELFGETQRALENVIMRIARISLQAGRHLQAA